MWVNNGIIKGLGFWLLAVILISGCSGHSVRTGAHTEGGEDADQDVMAGQTTGPDGSQGGFKNSPSSSDDAQAFGGSQSDGTFRGNSSASSAGIMGKNPNATRNGGSEFSGSDYGHNYPGVEGSGPNSEGVTGFGSGLARAINPDPESMDYGSGAGNNGSPSEESSSPVNQVTNVGDPRAWADSYVKENGGPSPEYINPDLKIAMAKVQDNLVASNDQSFGENGSNNGLMKGPDGNIRDIYFAFDSWTITSQGVEFLEEGAQWLQANPQKSLLIEGHCDQRGTQDYNLILGKKRAEAARDYLVQLGVQPGRIQVVSYGKERPFCSYDSEDCFQENRRSHMVLRVN